jgi:glycosyltransferase involved in cell wall biosynthesis
MMISVCIATYNGSNYIKDQLRSILSQIGQNDEVIISDDSSSDDTIEVIRSLGDQRIKIFPHNEYRNPVYNFEHALKQATGDIIFLSDQDDLWLEGKVEAVMLALKNADVVVTDCKIVDDQLNVITESYFKFRKSGKGLVRNLYSNNYLGCCMAFKRKILDKAIPFPPKLPMHDIWLGFISELFYRSVFIDTPYILHRRHLTNNSTVSEKSEATLFQRISFRWNTIKHWPSVLLRK